MNYRAAADYLKERDGHAMLVYRDGGLVFEEYFNGHTAAKPHLLASGAKSFSGAMAVAAQEDGLLNLDDEVSQTLTEWREDERKSRITIRQLLSLTSGIDGGDNGSVPSYSEAVKMARATAEPATRFSYGPIPFQCFGELMRRKLEAKGESVEAYLKRRILDPIGMKVAFWRKDSDGNIHLPSGAFLTATEWAKFGLLILNGGKWEGKTVLPEALLKECFKGSKTNPAYGLTFWLNPGGNGPKDLVMAAGKGKQKLYIIPSMDLLVVQFADADRSGYKEQEFLGRLLGGGVADSPLDKSSAEADAAPAPARLKLAPGTHEFTMRHDGRERSYRVRVPPGYDGSKPVPLVLAFHGGLGTAQIAERYLGLNPLADRDGWLVVYPQGEEKHWNDGRKSARLANADEVDDVGFIRALIGRLAAEFHIDPRRVYATGISNGGFMSHRLGWELSDILAAIAPAAGTLAVELEDAFAPRHPIHVLHMHGTKDSAVPIDGGMVVARGGECLSSARMVELWARANGCKEKPETETLAKKTSDPTRVIRETYAAGDKGAEVVFYKLEGHGHNWPGRTEAGRLMGPSSREMNAAEVAWKFFAKHPKAGSFIPDLVPSSSRNQPETAVAPARQPATQPGSRLAEGWRALDRDGDGRLSRTEASERPFFDRADADKDGFLTPEELRAWIQQLRPASPKKGD